MMKYTVVLNGCSGDTAAAAAEIYGFLSRCGGHSMTGRTIVFYCDKSQKSELVRCAPTEDVILIRTGGYPAEAILPVLTAKDDGSEYYFFAGEVGGELAVRLACRLNGSSLTGVASMDAGVLYKAVYGGYLMGGFVLDRKPYCLALARGIERVQVPEGERRVRELEAVAAEVEFIPDEAGAGLEQASFVLAVGSGVKSREKAAWVQEVAGRLGAELGVSRPVAMSSWAPLNRLVGVSGTVVRPKVCIAAGVSGAAAFFAGIEKSGLIVAVNNDARAPITSLADVVLIDDLEAVLAELDKIMAQVK